MRRHDWKLLLAVAVVIVVGLSGWRAIAGELTPPAGPVAPTMKTLDQLSAEHAAIQAALPAAGGGFSRVVRGVIDFPDGVHEASALIQIPALNPNKCVVLLSDSVYTALSGGTDTNLRARNGAIVTSLTANQITVLVDSSSGLARRVSYQIIEYP